jgi:hypothetical protein
VQPCVTTHSLTQALLLLQPVSCLSMLLLSTLALLLHPAACLCASISAIGRHNMHVLSLL